MPRAALTSSFRIGGVVVANRVLLAPLAGIGNWFVRLQARRHGAGLAVSEMVSSFALHHGNQRTRTEMLRIHPEEHPVALQLFGPDPSRAARATATATSGFDSSAAPAPVFITFGTGQPMFRSRMSAPTAATCAAADRMMSGSCPKSWMASGPSSGCTRSSSLSVFSLP